MKEKYFIQPSASVLDALNQLNATRGFGLVVVDANRRLLGTITDGDIRRALLRGIKIEEPVQHVMFVSPLSVLGHDVPEATVKHAEKRRIKVIPLLDAEGKVHDVYILDNEAFMEIPVVLMAGGLGQRLGDLTKDCPKPMLKINDKPILEMIIDNFVRQGFNKFYVSVNYKSEVIEDYFGDGKKFSCDIVYLKEKNRLGTAGALSLLPRDLSGLVLAMNADLLTQVDFRSLLAFHRKQDSKMTIGIRKYEFQIPYGVVNVEGGVVSSFDEKPTQSFFVSTGIYIIDTSTFGVIPEGTYFDMPQFLEAVKAAGNHVSCYPVVERWIDIGSHQDLDQARDSFDARTSGD